MRSFSNERIEQPNTFYSSIHRTFCHHNAPCSSIPVSSVFDLIIYQRSNYKTSTRLCGQNSFRILICEINSANDFVQCYNNNNHRIHSQKKCPQISHSDRSNWTTVNVPFKTEIIKCWVYRFSTRNNNIDLCHWETESRSLDRVVTNPKCE